MPNSSGPLCLFVIPSYGSAPAAWITARQALQIPLGAATSDQWILGSELSIAEKRNAGVKAALAMGARYVMFIGDDTIPPPHAFMQLLQQIQRNPGTGIVTGMYFSRSNPPQPMVWRGYMDGAYYNWHYGEFFEVDWAGCDMMLVDTSIFAKIPEPWFSQDYVFSPEQKQPIALATEDIYFYEKVRAHGYKAYCDASVQCIHQDRYTGQQFYLPPDWPQATVGSVIREHDDDYLVADLGAGWDSPYTHGKLVRFDLDESTSPDVRCDLHSLPEPDLKYDEVWSRHSLEHFLGKEAPELIREWSRILKVGGKIRINVPNLEKAIRDILAGPPTTSEYNWWQLYGRQETDLDIHKNGFTPRSLGKLLEYAWGIDPIHATDSDGAVSDGVGCFGGIEVQVVGAAGENLEATAVKVRHAQPAVIGPQGRYPHIWRESRPVVEGAVDADYAPMPATSDGDSPTDVYYPPEVDYHADAVNTGVVTMTPLPANPRILHTGVGHTLAPDPSEVPLP